MIGLLYHQQLCAFLCSGPPGRDSESTQRKVMPLSEAAEKIPAAEPTQKRKKKRTAKSYAISFFIKIALTAAVLWALLTWVGGIYICHDSASYPMIKDGDLCITYRLGTLSQGDAVVYRRDGKIRMGRVIAFGGSTVDIRNDYITVDGYGLFEDVLYPTAAEGAQTAFPYTVSENCVFVLNDYRSDLSDSRSFGGIPLSDVQGRVVFIMRRRGI